MSVNLPKSTWRLRTDDGIPIKSLSRKGSFGREDASASEVLIIKAEDLSAFISEYSTRPFEGTGILFPKKRVSLPGLGTLKVKGVDWESNDDGLPIDPFGWDPDAPEGTYCQDIKVTVAYQPSETPDGDEPDEDNPSSWLTISASASCQFLSPPLRKSKWRSVYTGGGFDEVEIKDPDVQVPIVCPMIEWSMSWPQINHEFFKNTLLTRMRNSIGKVNSAAMNDGLYGAPQYTFQFLGWSMSRDLSWRVGGPSVKLDMKFLEKNFKDKNDQQVTHYHHWKPGDGWKIIVDSGGSFLYPSTNLNNLFLIRAE